jgi:hypothetical protein
MLAILSISFRIFLFIMTSTALPIISSSSSAISTRRDKGKWKADTGTRRPAPPATSAGSSQRQGLSLTLKGGSYSRARALNIFLRKPVKDGETVSVRSEMSIREFPKGPTLAGDGIDATGLKVFHKCTRKRSSEALNSLYK